MYQTIWSNQFDGVSSHELSLLISEFHELSIKKSVNSSTLTQFIDELQGHFTIKISNANAFSIYTTSYELSQVIQNEAVAFLAHGYENLSEFFGYKNSTASRSATWNVICLYYSAFFFAQSFLRMCGKPIHYIPNDLALKLNLLASSSNKISSGTYYLQAKTVDVSSSEVVYTFKKSDQRIHELTWRLCKDVFELVISKSKKNAISKDFVVINALKTLSDIVSKDKTSWPSELRNKINYRPGLTYKMFENKDDFNLKRHANIFKNINPSEFDSFVDLAKAAEHNEFRNASYSLALYTQGLAIISTHFIQSSKMLQSKTNAILRKIMAHNSLHNHAELKGIIKIG